jgi:septum formation protein
VILASTSAVRAKLLRDAGVTVGTASPGVDEEALKAGLLAEGSPPRDIADVLAEAKATKVSRKIGSGLVIGADSTLELEGLLFDKPNDLGQAREHLKAFRGKRHKLHSAIVVSEDGAAVWRHVSTAILTVRDFSDAFLEQYIQAEGDALLGCVGCYRLEGIGAQLFQTVEGDYFAILGLPLLPLLDYLRVRGVASL